MRLIFRVFLGLVFVASVAVAQDAPPEPSVPPEPTAPGAPEPDGDVPAPQEPPAVPASPSPEPSPPSVPQKEDAHAQAVPDPALACVRDDDSPATLECVSTDGARHRFALAVGDEPPAKDEATTSEYAGGAPELGFVSISGPWAVLAGVGLAGVLVGAGASTLAQPKATPMRAAQEFLQTLPRPEPSLAPLASDLERLVQRTVEDPQNARAHLELAVALFEQGHGEIALRSFERAIHLEPEVLLVFLQEPQYAAHRERDDVRAVLRNVWRDRERRLAGYA